MKPGLIILLVIVVFILFGFMFYAGNYNSFVKLGLEVDAKWAQVENNLQRRYDLIPNLVNTVKGYAKHEKEVFDNIAAARAKMAGATTSDEKVAASNQLEGALSRLLMVVENYPQLKADQQFLRLQDELTGTENRLVVERKRYNDAVQIFNTKIMSFPSNMIAGMMGFKQREFFKVSEEAKVNPKVEF